ncbi:hypothetical protein K438DRAFT_1986577 [Mycena galopus ATCC 62051]|nr:hypothetical protein K438DRAFT_1986576 [Mycena galopus ATCC 62051]KAF8157454.1 hypothetical protein K438DRAFT_1986577 [Mycena galopus ATCC 62051]
MQFTVILSIFCVAFTGLVQAAPTSNDDVLVQIPSVDGMSAFIDAWIDVCTLWPPFNTDGLPKPGMTLISSNVVPGDFSGLNLQTEAIVLCGWTNGTTPVDITFDVADAIGAIILSA